MINNKLKAISAATVLACLGMQSAMADTFNFQFTGNGATATGSFTTSDTTTGTLAGSFSASFANLSALNVVVAGASAGNGTFSLANFNNIYFQSNGALNFTTNLVGQAHLTDFNLFGTGAPAPVGVTYFTLRTDDFSGVDMTLSCFYLQGTGNLCGNTSTFVSVSTPNSLGAAIVLDTAPLGLSIPIAMLTALTPAQQTNALQHIAPNSSRALAVASRQTVSGSLDSVASRIENIREQGYVVGMADDLNQGRIMVATNGDTSGLLDVENTNYNKHGFWMKGFGAHDNQDQKSGYAGYSSNTWGTAFGVDTLLENNWLVGGAFTYARTGVNMDDFRSGDDTTIKTYQATVYTSHDFGKWYLDGMLAYAKQKFNGSRDTTLTGIANSNFDGDQVAARINVGLPIALKNSITLTPMAGLEWNHLKQDGYTETGAGALSMNVQGETANRVRSVFGAKLSTQKDLASGLTILPSVHANWRHDFNSNGIDTTSTFTGGGAAFSTPGQELASNSYNIGAAIAFQKTKNFTFSVNLDGEKASGYNAVSGQVVGLWKF
ncbi:autotransporter outer membrane beta-barrel domain-containing protein [Methylotenera versatilis]|uniref:Outer membrane autotransporter barrel domain protein n=1 Tax=Methylotenera versatilis (strain 301) TaxID=666681 RepID=D7DKJ0_METV0|nr:autotransporter outer membrane beta-barrel domain-containing protein [Methylotenera versatilis]ADI30436.1 outer membrane autotransporter barrel domain protein [Methylotenera versatilis 301]